MNETLGLLVIITLVYLWYRNLTIRELAMQHSARACDKQSYQLLDGSVHLSGIGLTSCSGRRCLRRRYSFSYSSDRVQRHRGVTIMVGEQLESIIFSSPAVIDLKDS